MDHQVLKLLRGGYCPSLTTYERWQTREVKIGDVPLGGNHPIRVQSMTTIDTMDTRGSVEQAIRMVAAGCEYVRITAPSIKEAQNLAEIKQELRKRGCHVPLVADIHFTPNAAEVAARIVEKVRINPGNYADKKRFDHLEYTDSAYQAELERIYKKFAPLVRICKEYGTAMRIGTNHGSLSDRIMSRYGDTPEGMVESAMEFIRICEDLNFQELVISMKSSNPQVMVQAYRLLVEKMVHEGMNYPLHLGVTEAGDGEDGRIKSAVGIGTLLEDGLGDTIRVSLTEEPELEIPVAQALVNRYAHPIKNDSHSTKADTEKFEFHCIEPYPSQTVNAFIGTGFVPRIVAGLSREKLLDPFVLHDLGYRYDPLLDKFHVTDQSVDFVYLGTQLPSFAMPGNLKQLYDWPAWQALSSKTNCHPLLSLTQYLSICENHSLFSQTFAHGKLDAQLFLVKIRHQDLDDPSFEKFIPHSSLIFVLETDSLYQGMRDQRIFFQKIRTFGFEQPVIIKREYPAADFAGPIGNMMDSDEPVSKLQLYAGTDFGALLLDGMGQGVWIDAPSLPNKTVVSTAFGVLQATRSRISKTEYISCPSCGRTLFDLQETTQMIRNRTNHLKGLKIGIMGCIVNGPGEMADADYGYVGAGPDKITLYRGKEIVKKNVSSTNALDELIQIIKSDGKWIDLP